jgi:hypothetical protein
VLEGTPLPTSDGAALFGFFFFLASPTHPHTLSVFVCLVRAALRKKVRRIARASSPCLADSLAMQPYTSDVAQVGSVVGSSPRGTFERRVTKCAAGGGSETWGDKKKKVQQRRALRSGSPLTPDGGKPQGVPSAVFNDARAAADTWQQQQAGWDAASAAAAPVPPQISVENPWVGGLCHSPLTPAGMRQRLVTRTIINWCLRPYALLALSLHSLPGATRLVTRAMPAVIDCTVV